MSEINLILKELPPICMKNFKHKIDIYNKISNIASSWKLKSFLFGSLSMGVYTKDCDLDIVCVGTNKFTHDLFFKSFFKHLKDKYENVWVVDTAKVPIIKLVVNDISVDLSFISMCFSEFPSNFNIYTCHFDLYRNDKSNILSLCGVRVAKKILDLIPNINNFRVLIYIVKHWAKINGIYSNVLGFLGGISWTIMVAYVCIKYPEYNEYQLFERFFYTFSTWNWSKSISLNENNHLNSIISIFTPVQPYQNTSLNVLVSSKGIIDKKLKTAHQLISKKEFKSLFVEDYFFIYNSYFSFVVKCGHNFWFNLVESKVRNFIFFIEQQNIADIIHINTKIYSKDGVKCIFIGLKLKNDFKLLDLSEYMNKFKTMLYSMSTCKKLTCCSFNVDYFKKDSDKMKKLLNLFEIEK